MIRIAFTTISKFAGLKGEANVKNEDKTNENDSTTSQKTLSGGGIICMILLLSLLA